jgi:hypothetical protein
MEHYLGKHGRLNTGVGHTGVVEGIVTSDFWLSTSRMDAQKCLTWNEKDPGWDKGNVLWIKLDVPERACTCVQFEEGLIAQYGEEKIKELTNEQLEDMYKNMVPHQFYVCCPVNLFELTE